MTQIWKSAVVFCSLLIPSFHIHAADEKQDLKTKMNTSMVDMPVTTAPATFVLDAAGQTVPRVSTFRAFSAQFARAFDAQGNLTNTVAAEIAPVLAIGRLTWQDIEDSQAYRIAGRTTVSFASKAAKGSNPSQGAFGIQSVLYSQQMDAAMKKGFAADCRSASKLIDDTPPPLDPGGKIIFSKEVLEKVEACQVTIDAILTKWNQTVLVAGWGRRLGYEKDTGINVPDSTAYWITGSYGLDQESEKVPSTVRLGHLLTLHFRRSNNLETTNTLGTDVLAKQKLTAVNYRFGNAKLAILAEYSQERYTASGSSFENRNRKMLGLEYLLREGLYLTLGVADDTGLAKNKRALLTSLNWGFADKSSIFPK